MKRLAAFFWLAVSSTAGHLGSDEKSASSTEDFVIMGQIVPNDVRDRVRRFPCKIHTLKLSKDKAYVIDMESRAFDSYLRIEDSAGKQLAEDDDSGGNLNARIRFTPSQDDVYQIIATSFAGGAGPYTLKVKAAAK